MARGKGPLGRIADVGARALAKLRVVAGAKAGPPDRDDPERVEIEGFDVGDVLGSGGMGTVRRVRSLVTEEQYALKSARTSDLSDPNRTRAFLSEVETWIDVPDHPNIVKCRFFRTLPRGIGIFLEYVEGGTLKSRIDDGPLTDDEILDAAVQIAWALQQLHVLGLVHQDVKPGNILLGSGSVPRLTDFGLARAREIIEPAVGAQRDADPLVSAGGRTEAYCSPEQAEGSSLSGASDVWSFGLTLLTMHAGEVFWQHGAMGAQALARFAARANRGEARAIPQDVFRVLQDCLTFEPNGRPSMEEVAKRLAALHERTVTGPARIAPPVVAPSSKAQSPTMRETDWNLAHSWMAVALSDGHYGEELAAGNRFADRMTVADFDQARASFKESRGSFRAQAIAELAALQVVRDKLRCTQLFDHQIGDLAMQMGVLQERMDDPQGALAQFQAAEAVYRSQLDQGYYVFGGHIAEAALRQALVLRLFRPADVSDKLSEAVAMLSRMVEDIELKQFSAQYLKTRIAAVRWTAAAMRKDRQRLDWAAGFFEAEAKTLEKGVPEHNGASPYDWLDNADLQSLASYVTRARPDICPVDRYGKDRFIWVDRYLRERRDEFRRLQLRIQVSLGLAEVESARDRPGATLAAACRAAELVEGFEPEPWDLEACASLAEAHLLRAKALRRLDRLHEAMAASQDVQRWFAALDSDESRWVLGDGLLRCWTERALILEAFSRDHEALGAVEQAVLAGERELLGSEMHRLAPALAHARMVRGRLLSSQGRHQDAIASFDGATALLLGMFRGHVAEPRQADEFLLASRWKADALDGRADDLFGAGQFREAMQCWDEAIALWKDAPASDTAARQSLFAARARRADAERKLLRRDE